jgi:hypothetical protein
MAMIEATVCQINLFCRLSNKILPLIVFEFFKFGSFYSYAGPPKGSPISERNCSLKDSRGGFEQPSDVQEEKTTRAAERG